MRKLSLLIVICCFLMAAPAVSEDMEPAGILGTQGMLMLVNRDNRISKTYEPGDLVLPRVETRKASLQENIYLRKEAAQALERMFETARFEAGYTLYAVSGYRSYGIQQILFNAKVEEVGGRQKALRRVAPAGTSEHQLGLAIDIQAPSHLNLSQAFGQTQEGQWAGANAHRFGFILRYKREWSAVTGISDEPWHFRYVGIAHATAMYMLDIPLESYVEQAAMLPEYVLTGGSHVLLAGLIGEMLQGRVPPALDALTMAEVSQRDEVLRQATAPYLRDGQTYEQALWYAYPTPRPTAAPWVDMDEEVSLDSLAVGP